MRKTTKGVQKKRQNKSCISGNTLYHSYVSQGCKSLEEIQKLLQKLETLGEPCNEKVIQILLADGAVKLLAQCYKTEEQKIKCQESILLNYLEGNISFGSYDSLIWPLLEDIAFAKHWITQHKEVFQTVYWYEEREDVLGLLYISCKTIGSRKTTGTYYTPTRVVRQLITKLIEKNEVLLEKSKYVVKPERLFLDPCCGTGNFLLQLSEYSTMEQMYACDIDAVSVKIARLNMILRYKGVAVDLVCKHITQEDFLFLTEEKRFDYIIGNPPWGYQFSAEEADRLQKKYRCAKGKTIESYDVFVEQALSFVKEDGIVSFVLPEAILNVKLHQPVRTLMKENTSIQYLEFLGECFHQVQCPSVILQLKNTRNVMSVVGMEVMRKGQGFEIQEEREICPDCFSFSMTDEEYRIFRKISMPTETVFLKGNAEFALGIVTGNNSVYLSDEKTKENEVVLKGTDLVKFRVKDANQYMLFRPEAFQQVAPKNYYRASQKLLYRFISNQLVFAYDDRQRLSLNSCNIVIPHIPDLHIKYILAILNCTVAQFFFEKRFSSIKVLKSHIEQIPIPMATKEKQKEIIELVDKLLKEQTEEEAKCWYEQLEQQIYPLYGLSEEEYEKMKTFLAKK